MPELERLEYAKEWMDSLAEGVDPTSGEVLSKDTALNNVDLSRCFFYVSDVLRQVIENNGEIFRQRSKKPKLQPFMLPEDLRTQIEITETPAMITHFTDRINSLIDDNVMRKLKITEVTTWLVNNGLLCEEVINDKKRKKPTKAGEKIGIFSEEREGRYGNYLAVLYNESAQRYIAGNLEQITENSNSESIKQ